ncbi:MAG: 4Fe-4S dicluster domain-containing protein [Luteitalea sp.]|nr:4Fe-4S dicluster domain-containing protein [Luteitalea sp.]
MSNLDPSALRARLASTHGPTYWRSLEELADTEEFRRHLQREFPATAAELSDPQGRRQFLKLMGASMALAGVTACTRQPAEKIIPYVDAPEELVPGKPLFYATALPHGGFATPVLVESHEGRPTKVEPNPDHPATRGGTDVFAQGSVLTLYDPDRSRTIREFGEIRSWDAFVSRMQGAVLAQKATGGAGFRLLTETVTSPTLGSQIEGLLQTLPGAKWVQYDAISRDNARAGARAAFGRDVETRYRFDQADVILSLDMDFIEDGPGRLAYARTFIDHRRLVDGRTDMNRLYVVESQLTNTGAKADHRVAVRASDIEHVGRAVAAKLGVAGVAASALPSGVDGAWVSALARDLSAHRGRSVVVVGDRQPPVVHQLAHVINATLGNVGQTVEYTAPVEVQPQVQVEALRALAGEMVAGTVEVLVIMGVNPVYTAPADLEFGERLKKVPLAVHVGLFEDETAPYCRWHVPATHPLEAWSDLRTFDGTVTICQPLIAPLYDNNKSAHEVVAALSSAPTQDGAEIVKAFWQGEFSAPSGRFGDLTNVDGQPFPDFDPFWRQTLHDGFMVGSALAATDVTTTSAPVPPPSRPVQSSATEITFSADPTVYDGRFANNGWLQECPKPFNKVVWDNVITMSRAMRERLGLPKPDLLEQWAPTVTVRWKGREITGPVYEQPGQPDHSINVQLGYGRTRAGRVGNGVGYNAYGIRTTDAPWFGVGAEIAGTGEWYRLASTQTHFQMEGRNLVRGASLPSYQGDPGFAKHAEHVPPYEETLHGNEWKYDKGYAWGMVIDLNACTGCNACVVACTAENNIPIVGKDEVATGREMHWIRIDNYYQGEPDHPRSVETQPVTCMQCENAPCEVVCPVAATTHSTEGLNDMVYNRCVGTRYCQNNCPYKVRRFNFYLYADWNTPTLKMARNPDVTVRSRGVMEKCTYCVQRINAAKIQSELEDRVVRDGEIVTACESACPTRAITFGNINDRESRVAKLKNEPRNYGLLEDLNTRPRTTYLAVVRNPNPELAPEGGQGQGHSG